MEVKYLVHIPTGQVFGYNEMWEARDDFREATAEEVKAHMEKVGAAAPAVEEKAAPRRSRKRKVVEE